MSKFILLAAAAAAAGVIAAPAFAQPAVSPSVAGAATGVKAQTGAAVAATATPPVSEDPAAPPAASATAQTGAAANTSVAVRDSDLAPGTSVRDASGAELGKVLSVTKGKGDVETQVTLSAQGKTVAVPVSSLSASGDALVSSKTKAEIWGEPK